MVSQRENHIATQMWIRLGIYQSNMHVDTLGHLLATCVWIPFDIPKSNMHVDTLGHLKATPGRAENASMYFTAQNESRP